MVAHTILYWPKASRGGRQWCSDSSFLVGWKMKDHSVETTIVIGALPSSCDPEECLKKMAQQQKVCCDAEYLHCGRCIQKLLFDKDKLGIVGVNSAGSSKLVASELPEICVDERGYPLVPSDYTVSQVVMYDQTPITDASFKLYYHRESSAFTQSILVKLVHSTAVMEATRLSSASRTTTHNTDRPTAHQDSVPAERSLRDGQLQSLTDVLASYSLFFCHVWHNPFWPFAGSNTFTRCDTCTECRKTTLRSSCGCLLENYYHTKQQWITRTNRWVRILFESLLVVAMVGLILTIPCRVDVTTLLNMYHAHYRGLTIALRWLENFPIGLKLNVSFMEAIGREVQRAWDVHAWATRWILLTLSPSGTMPTRMILAAVVGCTGILVGASGVLTLLLDIYRLLFLHLAIFHWISGHLYAMELQMLASSWRLFRGKKLNPLRQRTDTMEYDSTQLLVGTISFVMVLFLFTTLFAYQMFFAILYVASITVPLPLAVLYQLLVYGPWGQLVLRLRRPGLFCRDVVIQNVGNWTNGTTTRLVERHMSVGEVFFDDQLKRPLQTLLSWPMNVLLKAISGAPFGRGVVSHIHLQR